RGCPTTCPAAISSCCGRGSRARPFCSTARRAVPAIPPPTVGSSTSVAQRSSEWTGPDTGSTTIGWRRSLASCGASSPDRARPGDATADRLVLFLVPHLYLTVFVASAVDAVGIPFPGRILLVLAGAFASSRAELALAIVASALGSL